MVLQPAGHRTSGRWRETECCFRQRPEASGPESPRGIGTTPRTAVGSGERFLEVGGRTPPCPGIRQATLEFLPRRRRRPRLASPIRCAAFVLRLEILIFILQQRTQGILGAA